MPGLLTRCTIYLMAFLWMNVLFSQQELSIMRSFTIDNGFPDNDVRWITQDSLGFLWIATWDGLVRYDGVEFKTYRHDPNVASSLGYFEVSMIIADKFNHIWIRTGTKLCRYNPAGDDFIIYNQAKITEGSCQERPEYFQTILADPDHVLHVKYGREFYRYNNTTDSFSPVKIHTDETDLSEINYAAFDDAGFLWLFELFSVKEFSKAYRLHRQDSLNYSVAGVYLLEMKHLHEFPPNFTFRVEIFNAPAGKTWMASNRGLYTISGDTVRLLEEFIPGTEFDHRNLVVWCQMKAGLKAWYKGKSFRVSETGSKDGVAAFFVDSQQNIWFTRIDSLRKKAGLDLTFRADNYFHQYFHKNDNRIPLNVFGLIKDRQGNIWAGGHPNSTLARISPSGEIDGIPLMFNKEDYYNFPRCMASDEKGMIWMASYDDYLYRFDPVSQSFEDCSDKGILRRGAYDKPRYRIVKTISNGKMILCGNGCIHKIDYDFRGQSSFHPDIRHIYSVYEDSAGWLWCGGIGKLVRLSPDLSDLQTFEISDNFYNIEDICPGGDGSLWLALLGGGMGRFDPSSGNTVFYTTRNGLAHNTVYALLKDLKGNIWASHDLGLSMFNRETGVIVNFSVNDGLQILEFDSEAAFRSDNGEMIFGGVGGIVTFYPDSVNVYREETPFPLLITSFKVSGKNMNFGRPVYQLKEMTLDKGTNNFQIELVKPDLRYGEEIRYRYKLTGVSNEWSETDSRHRRVNFSNLGPGHYEFMAEATDHYGNWASPVTLKIAILPYIYQTTWFKVMTVVLASGLIILFFFMKLKQIRLKEWRNFEQLKLESLRYQMNPHFISNTLNLIYVNISSNNSDSANRNISKLSRLMRALMNHSSADFINLSSEINSLNDYLGLQQQSYPGKFDFTVDLEDPVNPEDFEIMPFLVQPFAENAIKHGLRPLKERKGYLKILFTPGDESSLICEVTDDGIGRKQSMLNKTETQKAIKSRGMAIVNERIAIINSIYRTNYKVTLTDLNDEMDETGTKVTIEIPIKRKGEPSKFDKK